MAEHLQGLLNKIQEEGLKKAEAEKESILSAARAQAKEIVAKANAEADEIRHRAEGDAAGLQGRAESAVRQAARDVILALEAELKQRMGAILEHGAAEAMSPETMTQMLLAITQAYKANPANFGADDLKVLLNPAQLDKLDKQLKGALESSFRMKAEVFADRGIKGGFKVGFAGGDVYFDCTDQAVAALLSDYLSPKLAALLNTAEK